MNEYIHQRRVLVVDDDPAARSFLTRALSLAGYSPVAVADGAAALAWASDQAPDLLLLDYRLVGLDGLTLLDRLRASGVRAPALLISAHSDEPLEVLAAARGAAGVLYKPVDLQALYDAVAAVLRGRHSPPPKDPTSDSSGSLPTP